MFVTFGGARLLLLAGAAGEVIDVLVLLHVAEDHGAHGSVHQVADVLHPGADLVRVVALPVHLTRELLEALLVADLLGAALCPVLVLIWRVLVIVCQRLQ